MSTKAPVSKAPARKPAAKQPANVAKPAAKPEPAKPAPAVVAQAPAAEQPVWPVIETPAVEHVVTAVAETVSAVAADAAPALNKEVTTMTDTIKDAAKTATAKGEAVFADMNSRAKAAMEKSSQAFAELNDFNKGNLEALVESGKIAANGLQTLGQDYAEYARAQFEGVTATMKNFAGVKSPTEFLKLHTDFMKGQFDSFVAESSKNTEALIKLAGDVAKPISNRVAVAAEKLKVAA
ncbi:MAG: phasin family protein [Sphingomonas sp.]|uniref:phasin family protein n=1 Tax=Sphingomonas sp. TaxID=28214 RepID=UPI001AC6A84F|nr:phasin family protein [Sphingomonas sp.]MBN8809471.1 phasin family protein [Sphingomonas sp.]